MFTLLDLFDLPTTILAIQGAGGRFFGVGLVDTALVLLFGGAIASGLAIGNITAAGTIRDIQSLWG